MKARTLRWHRIMADVSLVKTQSCSPAGTSGFRESQMSGDFENHPLYKALSASDLYKGKPVSDVRHH